MESYLYILAVFPAAGCVVDVQASVLSGLCGGRSPPCSCRRAHHLIRAQATEAQRPPSLSSLRKLEGWKLREEQRTETTQTLLIVFTAGQTPQCTRVAWPGPAFPLSGEKTEAAVPKVTCVWVCGCRYSVFSCATLMVSSYPRTHSSATI